MYFILTYATGDDYIERRASLRNLHLALAKEYHEKGLLLMGGALADPADKAVLIFKCQDKAVVENFALKDPYVQKGVIASWEVREWTVVIGEI
ncbi:MAG: YciI-like protein [Anditalea sp.]